MKVFSLAILASNLIVSASAQNLIPDPGFEDYINCPISVTMLGGSLPLTHWTNPTQSSPDYYHVCNNNLGGAVGVPANYRGNQMPVDSNGYVGIYLFSSTATNDYKEYLVSELSGCETGNCALVPDNYYTVSIDVSLAEMSNAACDGIGVHFFTNPLPTGYRTSWTATLPFIPKINYSSYGVISDTVNWVTLVDTFKADSAYKYIAIGGVVHSQSQNIVRIKEFSNPYDVSYYYIDNVRVQPLISTNIKERDVPRVAVSPNPFKDKTVITLSSPPGSPYKISIFNILGKIVWQRVDVVENEIEIERQGLPSGVYYYQLQMKGLPVQNGKLMLE